MKRAIAGLGLTSMVAPLLALAQTQTTASPAQATPPAQTTPATAVFSSEVSLVVLPVFVVARDGRAMRGLQPPDFEIYEDGKLARGAATAYVNCDATIALPILVTSLSQTAAKYMTGRKRPNFIFMGREFTVEVP